MAICIVHFEPPNYCTDQQTALDARLCAVYKTDKAVASAVHLIGADRMQTLYDRTAGLPEESFLALLEKESIRKRGMHLFDIRSLSCIRSSLEWRKS